MRAMFRSLSAPFRCPSTVRCQISGRASAWDLDFADGICLTTSQASALARLAQQTVAGGWPLAEHTYRPWPMKEILDASGKRAGAACGVQPAHAGRPAH